MAVVERWRFDCGQFQYMFCQKLEPTKTCLNSVCAYVFQNISPNCIKSKKSTLWELHCKIHLYSKLPHFGTHDFGVQADLVLIYWVLSEKSA